MKFCLLLGIVMAVSGCDKEEEPPVVDETESVVKRTLETAKEKAVDFKETASEKATDLKESAGGALDKATDSVMSFKDRAFSAIKKESDTSED